MECISKRLDPFGTILRSRSPGLIVMALSSRPLNLDGWRLLLLAGGSRKFGSPPTSPCARYTTVAPKSVFSACGSKLPQTGLLNDWWRSVFNVVTSLDIYSDREGHFRSIEIILLDGLMEILVTKWVELLPGGLVVSVGVPLHVACGQ